MVVTKEINQIFKHMIREIFANFCLKKDQGRFSDQLWKGIADSAPIVKDRDRDRVINDRMILMH